MDYDIICNIGDLMRLISRIHKWLMGLDLWILIPYFLLCTIGVIMVYSASSNIGNPTNYLIKQTIFALLGFAALVAFSHFNLKKMTNKYFIIISLVAFAIALLYLKFFGQTINGAAGWFTFAGISLQPSEFAKLFFVIYMACEITKHQQRLFGASTDEIWGSRSWLRAFQHRNYHLQKWILSMAPQLLVATVFIFLIFIQPDLGGAVINAMIVVIMLMASGILNPKRIAEVGITGLVVITGILLVWIGPKVAQPNSEQNYQIKRITAVLHPFRYSQGIGKQLVNSFYAMSNGSIFGVGLGNSVEKTGYLPEPNTDFIMAVVAEELGLVAILVILVLIAILVSKIVVVGIRDNDIYYSLICFGVATYIMIETTFNIGGVIGILPITGVTFPFISYGGSSIVTLSSGVGMALNVARTQRQRKFEIQLKKA